MTQIWKKNKKILQIKIAIQQQSCSLRYRRQLKYSSA